MLKYEANLRLVETGEALSPGETRYLGMDYVKQSLEFLNHFDIELVRAH
jgi:hypothetical protein